MQTLLILVMKIKVILLFFLFCTLVNAQEDILPYYIGFELWPIHIPFLDTVKHKEFSLYKGLKIKEIIKINDNNISRQVETINENGYPYLSSRYWGDKLENQKWTGYNEQNIVTAFTERSRFTDGVLESGDTMKFIYEKNKPIKSFMGSQGNTITVEVIYDKEIPIGTKTIIETGAFKKNKVDELVYTGDTIIIRNKVNHEPSFELIKNGDKIIMTNGHTIKGTMYIENYKIIEEETKNWSTKYFYKENGLLDYSMQTVQGKETKFTYIYNYYD